MEKQRNKRIKEWAVCLACAVTMSACAYHTPDEDWERNGRVRLVLDWQTRSLPPVMAYYFYKDGKGSPLVRKGDASGYEGTLAAGSYKVVVCNTDYENVLLETDNGYDKACGRARQVSLLKSSAVSIVQPDNLYATGCEEVAVGGEETTVRELSPANLVRSLELNIKVTGGETGEAVQPRRLSGQLTGISSGVYLPSGKPVADAPALVAFEPEAAASGVYSTTLKLFCLPEKEEAGSPVNLLLDMELPDGREVSTSTDITDEIGEAFIENTFSVILDLTIRYDEIGGLSIILAEWKKGSEGSGVVDPENGE
ncbi:MAG: DUF5119 domain-containing protein [Parabacteroides gordonii]|jgi:hypothetical protein|uniref:DUF5119 domain-containing protein n=1 Tax=Parabacteroides gordonii TaxID=574930 RepID=UPI00241E6267|nr:DUF5119 domain-containing protein [Parabacteroides gordonii]